NEAYFMVSRTTGNRDLKPEEADTTGIGVVLAPSFLPGFQASVDYYNIDIDGAVATLGTAAILNRCHEGNAQLCALIERNGPGGRVSQINIRPENILGQEIAGIDVEMSYSMPLPVGDLRLRV